MTSQSIQVNKLHWAQQSSTQTQINVKYDKNFQTNLIDEVGEYLI